MQSQIASIHLAQELKRVATESSARTDKYRHTGVSQQAPHTPPLGEKTAGSEGKKSVAIVCEGIVLQGKEVGERKGEKKEE